MSFPVDLTAALSGASVAQLHSWRRTHLLEPEVQDNPVRYSFRDVVALRTFVYLRSKLPLQRIRKAMDQLRKWDLTEHPAAYKLVTEGDSVFLVQEERAIDLVRRPGQEVIYSLANVFAPFENMQGRSVADFRRPRPHLEVKENRLGGWPTIQGTRVPYDAVAKLVAGGVTPAEVHRFYPTVEVSGAADAADFHQEVVQIGGRAA
ncbi:DUF433 domain-containing protein [Streptomyces griseoluteus]|uniref:DUF433 domain-containing protein n=1 Tax=Streptomyces griseoluteus TaxID=29306 RepID=A0A4Z1DHR7_STRGP|nr:DUF433 domain-containing protein [Streptomyces griseoluteus]TGN83034.1 DUF433 domain-containing protein [Streptomyces griseoluteus]GHF17459.1 hypothetical protein GCM10017776_38970 [Streptomyces griseoluteus]